MAINAIPFFSDKRMATQNARIPGFFSPTGPLSEVLQGYEHRPQQAEMARAVATAIARLEHLVVEAGTGVGKSLAYLLPAFLYARRKERPVVVSTYTINLQQQLLDKDIELLAAALGEEIRAAAAIGRGNYLCLRRLRSVRKIQPSLFEKESTSEQLVRIQEWSFDTENGSLTDLDFTPRRDLWEHVNSSRFTCAGKSCQFLEGCFFRRARQKLRRAQIVVANHYLYFTDLPNPDPALRVIPEHSCVVFDEAHTLEEVASECLGLSVSQRSVSYLLQRIFGDERHSGLLRNQPGAELTLSAAETRGATRDFFDSVRDWVRTGAPGNLRIREPLPVTDTMSERLAALAKQLHASRARLGDDEELASEIMGCAAEVSECAQAAKIIRTMGLEGHVYWVEEEKKDISLRCAPVRVSGLLSQVLFSRLPTAVLTGATLAVGKDNPFAFLRRRLGLESAQELQLGSPFDYARQAIIHIEKGLPPRQSERHIPAMTQAMKDYLRKSRGRALVLFTSYERMRVVAERLAPFLEEQGSLVLVQGSGLSRAKLLEKFKSETDSVLLGTSSFWQGVDVPGEALSCVIIAHLPFAVPTLPLQQARVEEIEARGEDAFTSYSLPQAVIRLKQGVGRLIRSKTDTGSIVLLDSRVATKYYGRTFLESLPPCKILING